MTKYKFTSGPWCADEPNGKWRGWRAGYYSAASNTGYYSAASNTGDYSAASNTGDRSTEAPE